MPSPTDLITPIARPAVRFGISATRLPVDLVGRVLGEQDNESWPPAVVVEGLQASILRTAGSLLHDNQLSAQGRLLHEKIERLRTADQLEAEARAKELAADQKRKEQNEAAALRREQAAQRAEERKAAAARRAAEKKAAAEEKAAADAADAEEARAEAEQRVEAQQRKDRAAAIATERQAVDKEKAAATAARKAAATDSRIKAVNQARKA